MSNREMFGLLAVVITVVGELGEHLVAHCHTDCMHGAFLERFCSVPLLSLVITDSFKTSLQTVIESFTLTFQTYLSGRLFKILATSWMLKGHEIFQILIRAIGYCEQMTYYLGKLMKNKVWREFMLTVYKARINNPDESNSDFDR